MAITVSIYYSGTSGNYNLHMKVERYVSDESAPETDKAFIRK